MSAASSASFYVFLRVQGGATGDVEGYMAFAKDTIEQLKALDLDLRHQGQPNDSVGRT